MTDWHPFAQGPAAVAARDQLEAEIRDIIGDASIVFVAAARGDNPAVLDVSVRGICDMPLLSAAERRDAHSQFLLLAMDQLAAMVDELVDEA